MIAYVRFRGFQSGDVTAPAVSNPILGLVDVSTLSGSIDTDTSEGTLFTVLTLDAGVPSLAQIEAGQNSAGAAAASARNQPVTTTGTQTITGNFTGLAQVPHYMHIFHRDVAGNNSAILTTGPVTPLDLLMEVAALSPSLMLNTRDLSKMFTTDVGAVNVVNTNDPIGRIEDHFNAGLELINSNAAQRPLLNADGSIQFDGADDYLFSTQAAVASANTGGEAFAVAMKGVAQTDNRFFTRGNSTDDNAIIALGTGPGANNDKFRQFNRDDTGATWFNRSSNAVNVFDDTWHSIIVVDDTTQIHIYIDGLLDRTDNVASRGTTTTNTLAIGALLRTSAGLEYTGAMQRPTILSATDALANIDILHQYVLQGL